MHADSLATQSLAIPLRTAAKAEWSISYGGNSRALCSGRDREGVKPQEPCSQTRQRRALGASAGLALLEGRVTLQGTHTQVAPGAPPELRL